MSSADEASPVQELVIRRDLLCRFPVIIGRDLWMCVKLVDGTFLPVTYPVRLPDFVDV